MNYALAGWLSWLEHHPVPQKGCGFNSYSGHIPSFRVQSRVRVHMGGNRMMFLFLPSCPKAIKTYPWVRMKKDLWITFMIIRTTISSLWSHFFYNILIFIQLKPHFPWASALCWSSSFGLQELILCNSPQCVFQWLLPMHWNWLWWESLYRENWQTKQIRPFL